MTYGSAGTAPTSGEIEELRKDVNYHLSRAEQILSRIANRGNLKLSTLAHRTKDIRNDLRFYLDMFDPKS